MRGPYFPLLLPAPCMTLALIIAVALAAMAIAARQLRERSRPLAVRIDALLPQTQCGQCGHGGCQPYAEAVAAGAAINRCPPGGERLIRRLARLTGQPPLPLDTSCGVQRPARVAVIDESRCIGCTLCIQACPVDAIVGAPKLMHTVIEAHCTGCELCLPPCPVDCIALAPKPFRLQDLLAGSARSQAASIRRRFQRREARLHRVRREHAERMAAKAVEVLGALAADPAAAQARKRAVIAAALARAQDRLAARR